MAYGKKRVYRRRNIRRFRRTSAKRKRGTVRPSSRTTFSRQADYPSKLCIPLRYMDFRAINVGTSNNYGTLQYSANSIYAPFPAGSGSQHKPMAYTQWSAIFNNYIVTRAIITVKFSSAYASSALVATGVYGADMSQGLVGIVLSDNGTFSVANALNLVENPKSRYANLYCADARGVTTLRHYYSPKKLWSIKDALDNRSEIGAHFGSSPTELAYFYPFFLPASGTAPGASVNPVKCYVKITYYCMLSGNVDLTN